MSVLYAHFDIEADGPSPFSNNMISLGVSFTDESGKEVTYFLGDLLPLEGHSENADTMKNFWYANAENKKELERIRENAKPAWDVMANLHKVIDSLKERIVWVASPSAYDWQWLNYYHNGYRENRDPKANLSGRNAKFQAFKAVCTSTMRDVYQAQFRLDRKAMEAQAKEWAGELAMTHNPLDDARYQAKLHHKLFEALVGK